LLTAQIGLRFELRDECAQLCPCLGLEGDKLQPKLLDPTPTHDGVRDAKRGLGSGEMYRELDGAAPGETSAWLDTRQPRIDRSMTSPSPLALLAEVNELRNWTGKRGCWRFSINGPYAQDKLAGCSKRPLVSPVQPRRAETRRSASTAAASEEAKRSLLRTLSL
jgi:hypothetical protein